MDDEEFNYYRLLLVDKHVSLLALKEVFELLWDKRYPSDQWKSNNESVMLFEAKVKETSNKKKCVKSKITTPTDTSGNWSNYQWDTNKVVYALVDSKLFEETLIVSDDDGKPVSEHMTDMRRIRNKIAHLSTCSYETDKFARVLDEMTGHINALALLQIEDFDLSKFHARLQDIKTQTKPVLQEFYKEKQRMKELIKQIESDREKISGEYQKLDNEKTFLIETIETLRIRRRSYSETDNENGALKNDRKIDKNKHSPDIKYENLNSDFNHLANVAIDVKNRETVEIKHLKAENEYIEKIIDGIKEKHYIEIDRYKSENNLLKEILTHSAEISQLNYTVKDLEKKLKDAIEENDRVKSENTEIRKMLERVKKDRQRLWSNPKNINVFHLLACYHCCILIVITLLQTTNIRTSK